MDVVGYEDSVAAIGDSMEAAEVIEVVPAAATAGTSMLTPYGLQRPWAYLRVAGKTSVNKRTWTEVGGLDGYFVDQQYCMKPVFELPE